MAPVRPGERASAWREPAYRLGHELLSAADRVWYRRSFDEVERFCLFAGYARSGHSIVGAVLDAHREAVIAHELEVTAPVLAGIGRDELDRSGFAGTSEARATTTTGFKEGGRAASRGFA
jgi:hypothetical protein